MAAPASGGDTPPDKGAGTVEHRQGDTTPLQLQDSLQSHGVTGVPGEEREGRALKEWIVAHQDDESVRAALKACDVYFGDQKPDEVGRVGKTECSAGRRREEQGRRCAKQKGSGTVRVRPAM